MPLGRILPSIRIKGELRDQIRADVAALYADGWSIRQIQRLTGRSYGFIWNLLEESDLTMRPRGGHNRGPGKGVVPVGED